MCGIAGIIDLTGDRPIPAHLLQRMADAIVHRGPDEDGYFTAAGIGLASRRLSIVGLADGRQPITNEDGSIVTVYNGEFFDYPEKKAKLERRGHHFRTHCDTELIPHLWEEHQEQALLHLRGQFALAVWDKRSRSLVLGRDRFGICPLYFTRQRDADGEWLLFASEIKALLASGMVTPRADPRGIDCVFNYFAAPGPATCFEGIEYLQPGQYLSIQPGSTGRRSEVFQRYYWQITFPNRGDESRENDQKALVDEFERLLLGAVERRLRADVPVVSYLSGGIDSSLVLAMATKIRGATIPAFSIKIEHPRLDEASQAVSVAKHVGAKPFVVSVGDPQVLRTYPELIRAAEAPVIDTSCAALLLLARAVNQQGYKATLTGEGADEWLAGYPWYKLNRLAAALDVIPGLPMGRFIRYGVWRVNGACRVALDHLRRIETTLGDHSAFQEIYSLMALSRSRFYSAGMLESLRDYSPYLEMEDSPARVAAWHPVNRGLYWGARIHLAGHLLTLKGDRIAMNSSLEMRYPYLDEEVFEFLAGLHPRWKLRGLRDKYILRLLGERYLPRDVAWRPKKMFRAPRNSFFRAGAPPFAAQLLSEDSINKTGYFDFAKVQHWYDLVARGRLNLMQQSIVELGLMGVVATQLWHQTFIDPSLADVPEGVDAEHIPQRNIHESLAAAT
jgi:asparagine synthase (glutamine-hydrolysing)